MRRLGFAIAFLPLVLFVKPATAHADIVRYTPPAEPGVIYTVINFPRAGGAAQGMTIFVNMSGTVRKINVAPPYAANSCSTSTPSGIVLKTRHSTPDATPIQFRTDGTIVRPPLQGGLPMEATHACYKIQT